MKACPAMITCAVLSVWSPRIGLSRCLSWLLSASIRVVGVSFDVVPRLRGQLFEHGWVDGGGVGDHLGGVHLQHRQRAAEEPAGRTGVAAGRHEHVDDLRVLVDGPVHVAPHAGDDLDVCLVDEPPVTW
ncbi:hypothetical protein GCM10009661_49640 [Catellatospora chokoriensis]|uniref:Uncharacterized protein n=1 Tax=Catellatospora chokoriensis TaxID=310353 RepID=A0A8J3KEV6_9ACTN|nr:hypothetical protein Cch02nite_72330 [Catellatospora chokoriensis]